MANQLTYKPGSLETMTVQQAKDAGRLEEYNQLVQGFGVGPITTNQMGGSTVPIKVPETNNNTNYNGITAGVNAYTQTNPPPTVKEDKPKTAADLYKESVSGLESVDRAGMFSDLQEKYQLEEKADAARNLKARIDAINAQSQAAMQTLESQSGGKDVTSTFLGRQQQEVQRQAAIQTLPLTAEYQATLGDYQAAQDTVNQLYQLQVEDAQAEYDRKMKIYEIAYSLASEEEQAALKDQQRKEDQAFDLEKMRYADELDRGMAKYKSSLAGSSGELTSRQNINLSSITTKYQADKTIQAGQSAISAREIADQVIADPGNAGNQLKILYTFIKSLDPESAVREGELSLAKNTQSYLSRFKTEIQKISEDKGISDAMATQLAESTKTLADQWTAAAERRDNFYKSQANVLGVGDYFDEYLTGTRGAIDTTASPATNAPADVDYEAEYNALYGTKETVKEEKKQEPKVDYITRFQELTKPPTYNFTSWFKK